MVGCLDWCFIHLNFTGIDWCIGLEGAKNEATITHIHYYHSKQVDSGRCGMVVGRDVMKSFCIPLVATMPLGGKFGTVERTKATPQVRNRCRQRSYRMRI